MRASSLLLLALLGLALPLLVSARLHERFAAHITPAAIAEAETSFELIDASNIDRAFTQLQQEELKNEFETFKRKHLRKYPSPQHEQYRFNVFKSNMARAAELNRLNPEAKFGVTRFADLHPVEFKRHFRNFQPLVGDKAVHRKELKVRRSMQGVSALPDAWDWRHPTDGRPVAVTPVKDQGQCGSCWAFSATEQVESDYIMAGGKPTELSPQQTVDCDKYDGGCNGGDTITAYKYMQQAGVQCEQSYPYFSGRTGRGGECKYNATAVIAKISGFTYATPGCDDSCTNQDEETLRQNLYQHGPVSICVDASPWQWYQSGILTPSTGCASGYYDLNHCVQLVGYGVDKDSGAKYWSARNSWSTSWGEAGYIRLSYGQNTCGVADEATQVQIVKA